MAPPREQSRRATNSSAAHARASAMAASTRPGMRHTSTHAAPGGKRASTARYASAIPSAAALASRFGRAGAVSPAESMMSVATNATTTTTAAGMKRKERDYEADGSAVGGAGCGEETNIHVVVRCRGRTEREVRENSAVMLQTKGTLGQTVELTMGPNALSNKTYQFDRVFSPAVDQSMVFDEVVRPMLEQLLAGYNCTIFAYGQTGTGKTYTMSGDMRETLGLLTDGAGIIPRVLQALFQRLEAEAPEKEEKEEKEEKKAEADKGKIDKNRADKTDKTDKSDTADIPDNIVRCSFIELYNEELRDLLAAEGEGGKLKIYDDNSRRGHSTTMVQGMEERHIGTAAEGIRRLQEGSERRQVAATQCNDLSSRSHTVFTITVQRRLGRAEGGGGGGEEQYVTGKLNLVDLAGSENIARSGAADKRAAEAGLINKSLLTLGRVINALVDRTAHVPYRESKLTRLLQDSLGGRTKTCIIATVSTAQSNVEETVSTLDYAFRAKNIRNKPQVNGLASKRTLLRELAAEVERLRGELVATRQRHGVYLTGEAYETLTVQSESRRVLAEEQGARIETMEKNLDHKLQELFDLTASFMGLKREHEGARVALADTAGLLAETERALAATRTALATETQAKEVQTERAARLAVQGTRLRTTLQRAAADVDGLRAKDARRAALHGANRAAWGGATGAVAAVTQLLEDRLVGLQAAQAGGLQAVRGDVEGFVRAEQERLGQLEASLHGRLRRMEAAAERTVTEQGAARTDIADLLADIRAIRHDMQHHIGDSLQSVATAAERIANDVLHALSQLQTQLQTAFGGLGDDVGRVLGDVLAQTAVQRRDADALQAEVVAMGAGAQQASAALASQIEAAVAAERAAAAAGRMELLAQIQGLLDEQAAAAEARLAAQASDLGAQAVAVGAALDGRVGAWQAQAGAWQRQDDALTAHLADERAALQARLAGDGAAAATQTAAIAAAARAVHATTVRVVESQTAHLAAPLAGLEDMVRRATAQQGAYFGREDETVGQLQEALRSGCAEATRTAAEARQAAEAWETALAAELGGLAEGLATVDEELVEPLAALRRRVEGVVVREYEPTGGTPVKVRYVEDEEMGLEEVEDVEEGGEGGEGGEVDVEEDDVKEGGGGDDGQEDVKEATVEKADKDADIDTDNDNNVDIDRHHRESKPLAEVHPNIDLSPDLPDLRRSTRIPKQARNALVADGRENLPPGRSSSRRRSRRMH